MNGCCDPHVCFLDGEVVGGRKRLVLEPPVLHVLEVLETYSERSPTASIV